ncbi:F0F1 ATP synthase subunit B family protein [Azospirillum agricola]|uniref:F0F1 ATP synthase subunit B family protein n=1 Tax=Azospirillum agricola TaxID=1720247 RepID=UPI000A0F1466|nr:ATPase [Azospirillum agricola]MBP2227100.1 F-type H+-transporting ATPase subunit b [Azospirillum agricola]SMH59174.1 F-type H+-transporting ATPase subunit b [Azospirillum lipoferum]
MPNLLAKGRLARWSGVAGASLVTLTTMAGTVLAAAAEHAPDAAHGGEHASGGLPQLNPANFPTQIFWLALTFGVLYYLLSKKALPRVAEVLEARQERISRDLAKAAQLKDEAEAVLAQVEASLAGARAEALTLIGQASADIEANNQARQAALSADIAERLRTAEASIAAAKEQALANVRTASADIARDIAGRLAGVDVDQAQADAAVAAVIEERRG